MEGAPVRRLVGVGVGPGDPEHLTVKAINTLRSADVILVPATERSAGGAGRAEAIVLAACPEAAPRLRRVPFSMADPAGVTARRREAWDASAEAALTAYDEGARTVALATVGDPSVYSTFSYLAGTVTARLPDVAVELVPGITAMQALAAAARVPLVEGTEVLALVPVTAGADALAAALSAADTVVAYKAGRHLPAVRAELAARGRLAATVVGQDVGTPAERVVPLTAYDDTAPYFATLLIPADRTGVGGAL